MRKTAQTPAFLLTASKRERAHVLPHRSTVLISSERAGRMAEWYNFLFFERDGPIEYEAKRVPACKMNDLMREKRGIPIFFIIHRSRGSIPYKTPRSISYLFFLPCGLLCSKLHNSEIAGSTVTLSRASRCRERCLVRAISSSNNIPRPNRTSDQVEFEFRMEEGEALTTGENNHSSVTIWFLNPTGFQGKADLSQSSGPRDGPETEVDAMILDLRETRRAGSPARTVPPPEIHYK